MQRRAFLALAAQFPASPIVDTHIHLFAADKKRFPFHPAATYQPKPATLEDYVTFVRTTNLTHAVIVHPEPYQDDHTYLEYCLENDFFKGTCLFDAMRPDTPSRIDTLIRRWPNRIRAMRFHRVTEGPAQTTGPIRERPLDSVEMKNTWRALADRNLMAQIHCIPKHAPAIAKLAAAYPSVPVIIDHMARHNQGTNTEWRNVLSLSLHRNVNMKISGLEYSPLRQQERIRELHDAFGPDRLIWGTLGMDTASYTKSTTDFSALFAFTTQTNREKIQGRNAMRLYGWSA